MTDRAPIRQEGLLVSGFVADRPDESTLYAAAGGQSGDPRVQQVYWRCLVVLYASARMVHPDLRLALVSNVSPPEVDGIDLAGLLRCLGVELYRVDLTHRLPSRTATAWGNVLYFSDIFDALQDQDPELPIILVDSDVVVTRRFDALLNHVRNHEFVGYPVESAAEFDINGMDRWAMTAAASELDQVARDEPICHYGGEFLGLTPRAWRRHRATFDCILQAAGATDRALGQVRTEEHVWSIALATMPTAAVGHADAWIKRIWTSPRYNTARPGDQELALWHLPAEKRYGLADLFAWLRQHDFLPNLDPAQWRAQVGQFCGVPRKSWTTSGRHLVRQGWNKLLFQYLKQ